MSEPNHTSAEPRRRGTSRVWLVYVLVATWAAALFAGGMLNLSEPMGIVGLAAAGLTLVVLLLGATVWTWMEALYGAMVVAAGATIALGVVLPEPNLTIVALGVVALIAVGAAAPIAWGLRALGGRRESSSASAAARSATTDGALLSVIERLHETSMLSDNAKRVLFRRRELQLLQDAIEEDIARGDHNAALTLCDALSTLFGQREQSEQYRARITSVRRERYEADIDAGLERFHDVLHTRDWAEVHQEAAKLRRLYPDSHLINDLDNLIFQARDEHKRGLERSFLQAAEQNEISDAMALLRELDRYLDPDEAERLSEVAQGVITKHRENLGDRFRDAVNDHGWAEAASLGNRIIAEFPNTKMADEVRSMIDVLRTRATEAAVTAERA